MDVPSTSSSDVNEVVSTSVTGYYPEHAEIWLECGEPPVSTDGTDYSHDRSKRYTYVHLAYQSTDNQDYRVRFEYGQPIALDVTYDAGTSWSYGSSCVERFG